MSTPTRNCVRVISSLLLAIGMLAGSWNDAVGQTREVAVVRTIAGSGTPGFSDGPHGSFLMPVGVTHDSHGILYVSDGAAQRIRRVERDGSIHTIAGGGPIDASGSWVAGGYRDGAGPDARFDRPAGIAFRRDGYLYVADTYNHCIRRISPEGVVSTYAGSPNESAQVDGPLATARFLKPVGLAVDAEDNLYVADYSGIRRIDPQGNVLTAPGLGINPYAVAVYDWSQGVTIFVGDRYGIVTRPAPSRITDASADRRFASLRAPELSNNLVLNTENGHPLGLPTFLAALDQDTVVYTDLRSNTIRLLEVFSGEDKILAGTPAEDGGGNTAGYRDGSGTDTKLFTPLGIARATAGGFVFADAGNRRIRSLSAVARLDPWETTEEAYPGIGPHPSANEYRIAYIGNSFIWYDTAWSDSIEGLLQSRLAADPFWRTSNKHPRVIPILGLSLPAVLKFARSAADSGLYDTMVFNLNWGNIVATFSLERAQSGLPPDWRDQVTGYLSEMRKALAAKRIGFLVVAHPAPTELSPTESSMIYLLYDYLPVRQDLVVGSERDLQPNAELHGQLLSAVRASGATILDLWPEFLAQETSRDRRAMFGSGDIHFTAHARRLVAEAVAARLEALAPWKSP